MITVTTESEFKNAVLAAEPEIFVANNISLTSQTSIGYAVTITGAEGVSLFWASPADSRDMLLVTANGDLTVGSLILDAEGRNGTLVQVSGGRFTMNGGVILRNIYSRSAQNAVCVGDLASTDGGTFIMNGGLITGVDSSDAVFCSGGTVVMNNDAAIDNNLSAGISMANARDMRSSLTMTGRARVSNNQSRQGASAGIIMDGDVVMGENEGDAPIVTGNRSPDNPVGGFLIVENSALTMRYGAEISDNYSLGYGGGLTVDNGTEVFMYDNATIKNNRCDSFGAGLLSASSTITIADQAQIYNNLCSSRGGGLNLQRGTVLQMTGSSSVHSNIAESGSGIYLSASSASVGLNGSSPQIYGNESSSAGGGVFISAGSRLNLTGRAKITGNIASEGKGIYKMGKLTLSQSPQVLDGLFFDDLNTDGDAVATAHKNTSAIMRLPLDSPDPITVELPFAVDGAKAGRMRGARVQAFVDALPPTYTDNVPIIADTLTNIARIQLEASGYVSRPNVALVIADKGPSGAPLAETDRAAWRIPSTFGSEHRVILNSEANQVLIDFQVR